MRVIIPAKEAVRMFDALDTHGGHVAVCLLLLLIGAGFIKAGIPEGRDIIIFSTGVLARSMYGSTDRNIAKNPPTEAPGQ